MTDASCISTAAESRRPGVLLPILSTVAFTFATYLTIGLSLSVLPGFVHGQLGFGAMLAGLAISMQYVATLISRPHAGRMADTLGPKRTVQTGLTMCAVSGALLLVGALAVDHPLPSLGLILLARLALGCAESCVGTGSIAWGMGQVGHEHTARVISWNGVATYGALAAGAPLGVLLQRQFGFAAIGVLTLALMLGALPLARLKRATLVASDERSPFRTVAARVVPYGVGLALGSIGFGCIATFITLFYAARGWSGAALTLSVFGVMFVGVRFVFGRTINWLGGYRVAMASLAIEAIGLLTLWLASDVRMAAMGAAIAGLGFSLVFPALGVEAVQRVPEHSRGSALGVFSVFLDVAMAIAGPIGGWIASGMSYSAIYGFAAVAAMLAIVLTLVLQARATVSTT
ncbi:MFS transporter [Rhodanobacter sp. C01]|uniref:MFS transporter n=1 Tax=Rhodanobacter sp. C01 TaxID=1945856 RepID=UPI0009867C7B|nr:MFS transporter [Rhodanobacter sp. C01]OOG49101.1 MFS transporter [Rhodanobacter sp. C01]